MSDPTKVIYNCEYRIVDAEFGRTTTLTEADSAENNSLEDAMLNYKINTKLNNKLYTFNVYLEYTKLIGNNRFTENKIYGFTYNNGNPVYSKTEFSKFIKDYISTIYYKSAQHIENQSSVQGEFVPPKNGGDGSNLVIPPELELPPKFFIPDIRPQELEQAIGLEDIEGLIDRLDKMDPPFYDKSGIFNYINQDPKFGALNIGPKMDFVNKYVDYRNLLDSRITPELFINKYGNDNTLIDGISIGNRVSELAVAVGYQRQNMTNSHMLTYVNNDNARLSAIKVQINDNNNFLRGNIVNNDTNNQSSIKFYTGNSNIKTVTLNNTQAQGLLSITNKFTSSNYTIKNSDITDLQNYCTSTIGMTTIEAQYFTVNLLKTAKSNGNLTDAVLTNITNAGLLANVDTAYMTSVVRQRRMLRSL